MSTVCTVIVDPFSSGAALAESLCARGAECVAVISSRMLPESMRTRFDAGTFREVVHHEGQLEMTANAIRRHQPRFILAVNDPDFTRLFVIDYLDRGARYNVLDIWHGEAERDFEVWSVEYPLVLLQTDQARLLENAGLADFDSYGGYASEPYDPEASERLIVVARN